MNASGTPARAAALGLLRQVMRRRRPLDEAIAEGMADGGRLGLLPPRDRAFARLLVATALRRLGQLDAALEACLQRPLAAASVEARDVLRLGAAQLLFLGTPAHAAVAATVQLLHREPNLRGLANAVLRRLSREGSAILAAQDAERLNCPDWLWHSWCAAYGEADTRAIVARHLADPPLDFSLAGPPGDWPARLEARLLPTGTLRRQAGGAVERLPGYAEGAWWVQDAAAALPVRLLGDVAGAEVLDLCAAPGGKTLQLCLAGAAVVAVDLSEKRLAQVRGNLHRLGATAELVAADATAWRPQRPAGRILLDAPCSATGTVRRHPDVWRLKTPEDVSRLAALQARLLAAAVDMLAPGGTLVYCVCSLEPAEGPEQVERLLAGGAPVARRPVRAAELAGLAELLTAAGDLRTLPCHLAGEGGMDGFYACRLVRA